MRVGALGDFVLEECGKHARGGPAFGIGGLADGTPKPGNCGQAQLAEKQRQARGVAGDGHAATFARFVASSWS